MTEIRKRLASDGFARLIGDTSALWIDRVVADGRAAIGLDGPLEGLLTVPAEAALSDALRVTAEHRDLFVHLGRVGFTRLLAAAADGDMSDAKALYLAHGLSFEGRIALQNDGSRKLLADAAEREEAWATVERYLLQIGKVGLRLLVTVAAGALL